MKIRLNGPALSAILLTVALLAVTVVAGQSFDYEGGGNGNLGIRSGITRPLAKYMPLIFNFTIALVAVTGMVMAGRIYALWQAGEENVFGLISRWFFGLILVTVLVWFLKEYYGGMEMPIKPDLNF